MSTFTTQNQPPTRFTEEHGQTLVRARQDSILRLHERGLVPVAISNKLGFSLSYVSATLRDAGVVIPSYLETQGPRPEPTLCPHCGKTL